MLEAVVENPYSNRTRSVGILQWSGRCTITAMVINLIALTFRGFHRHKHPHNGDEEAKNNSGQIVNVATIDSVSNTLGALAAHTGSAIDSSMDFAGGFVDMALDAMLLKYNDNDDNDDEAINSDAGGRDDRSSEQDKSPQQLDVATENESVQEVTAESSSIDEGGAQPPERTTAMNETPPTHVAENDPPHQQE